MFFHVRVMAQAKTVSEYEVKAAFLYNFTRFIDWPPQTISGSSEPFVIGIIGGNPFGKHLEEVIKGENVGTHPITIVEFNKPDDISKCHILYINSTNTDYIRKVLKSANKQPVLTICESVSFPRLGGHIRFFTEDSKIRFMVNTDATRRSGFKISSKLLSVAKIY
jgi:hypothetical protein